MEKNASAVNKAIRGSPISVLHFNGGMLKCAVAGPRQPSGLLFLPSLREPVPCAMHEANLSAPNAPMDRIICLNGKCGAACEKHQPLGLKCLNLKRDGIGAR